MKSRWQSIPAGKGSGLLPAGQQQSLIQHMALSKINCCPGGVKSSDATGGPTSLETCRQGGQSRRQTGSAPFWALPPSATTHIWTRGSRGCLLAAVGELLEYALLLR